MHAINTILKRAYAGLTGTLLLLTLFVLNSSADIIWFEDGGCEEGRTQIAGDRLRVYEREGTGMYEIPTNLVQRIDRGLWLADLEPGFRKKATMTIVTNAVTASRPEAVAITTRWDETTLIPQLDTYTRDLTFSYKSTRGIVTMTGVIVIFVLIIIAVICEIMILVDAFKKSLWWGLACLFIPLVFLYYLAFEYTGNKLRMTLLIFSPLIFVVLWWWLISTYVSTGIL